MDAVTCGLLFMLTCAVLTTSSHSEGPFDPHADAPAFPPNTDFPVPAEPCLSDPVYKKPCSQANIEARVKSGTPFPYRESTRRHVVR